MEGKIDMLKLMAGKAPNPHRPKAGSVAARFSNFAKRHNASMAAKRRAGTAGPQPGMKPRRGRRDGN